MTSSTLQITVGTGAASHLTLEHDLRLLKAALLYGDRVKLCSLMSSMLVLLSQMIRLSERQRLDALEHWGSILPGGYSSATEAIRLLRQLKEKRNRSKGELLLVMKTERLVNQAWAALESKINEIAAQAGADGLVAALQSGLLELEVYEHEDTEQMLSAFLRSVGDAVASGDAYPLFDDQTGDLVHAAFQEGRLEIDNIGAIKGRIAGLAADLLQRLPLFDNASVEDILAIRNELKRPLMRFRSAIIEYSRLIESAQWEPGFKVEADLVFRERVEPAVADLEDELKANRFATELMRTLISNPLVPVTSSGLGLVVSNVAAFSPLAGTSLGIVAGLGTLAYSAIEEWQERYRDIERNQLYFYYRAGQCLRGAS